MKSFKKLVEDSKQHTYILKQIFNEGDVVENVQTGEVGEIIRRGVNYVICITEEQKMFRSWVKNIRPHK